MSELEHARRFLKARWVLPMDVPPVENGVIEVCDGRIVAVHRQLPAAVGAEAACIVRNGISIPAISSEVQAEPLNAADPARRRLRNDCLSIASGNDPIGILGIAADQRLPASGETAARPGAAGTASAWSHGEHDFVDCGEAVILPGFVNLHSHIEYTKLRGFDTTSPLFSWIPGLMAKCRTWQKSQFLDSARAGAVELLRSGTTCVVDSSYTGQAAIALGELGLRGIVALELFGIDELRADELWANWLQKRQQLLADVMGGADSDASFARTGAAIEAGTLQISVAPHALYTVSPQLMQLADRWSEENGLSMTVHVAESKNEFAWTDAGDECVDGFLAGIPGVLPAGGVREVPWRARGCSPMSSLAQRELLSNRLIAAHCVQISERDFQHMANSGMTVAHCPRSNARLRNGVAPLGKLLASGINVGFGTDSAASNDNLDLLEEARFASSLQRACHLDSSLDAEKFVRMLTCDAAKAAGLSHLVGTLTAGKMADMVVFNLADCGELLTLRPYEALACGPVKLQAVYVGGKLRAGNVL